GNEEISTWEALKAATVTRLLADSRLVVVTLISKRLHPLLARMAIEQEASGASRRGKTRPRPDSGRLIMGVRSARTLVRWVPGPPPGGLARELWRCLRQF